MKTNLKIIIAVIGIFFFLAFAGAFDPKPLEKPSNPNCQDLNLSATAKCLNNEVNSFFIYNISNLNNELSDEQLKTEGGVCYHYANYYNKRASELGFNTKYVSIDTANKISHAFSVISDGTGYCIMDQTKYWCFEFG